MVCIVDRLQKTLNRKISSEQIWKHLKTMYNLKALDDSEPLPFPNHEENFDLPLELQTKLKKKISDSEDGEASSVTTEKRTCIQAQKMTSVSLNKSSSAAERSERSDKKSQKSESDQRIPSKRTRGSHHDAEGSSSPASTPPQTKRRRI